MKDIKRKKARVNKKLTRKLELLVEGNRDDDHLMDLIDAKIQLNFEIDMMSSFGSREREKIG